MSKLVSLFSPIGVLGGLCTLLLVAAPAACGQQPDAGAPPDVPPGANDTEILANQGATFTSKDRVAVFNGDVRVHDPRFNLASDKLTVYLAKGAVPEGGSVSTPPTPALTATPPPIKAASADPNAPGTDRGGGIDHAVAEGHVTIVQKRAATKPGEEEKISVGTAETVEYDNKTGNVTLRGWPKVRQNGDSHEALSASTYMVMHRDNSLDTFGPSKTHIVQRAKDSDPPGGAKPTGKPTGAKPTANRRPSAGKPPQG